ncbi:MAG: response regulator [Verrucomicrobiales bacterium]|nr:response regulator [Verrucomicrobiales bacterium]
MSCKLIVADDSDNDFLLLANALEETPEIRLVHRSPHGQEIIDYLAGKGIFADRVRYPWPDLLCLDLNMPICGGLGVLRWLSQQSLATMPRVVVLSASSILREHALALALGADEFQAKPNDRDRLVTLLKEIHERWASSA